MLWSHIRSGPDHHPHLRDCCGQRDRGRHRRADAPGFWLEGFGQAEVQHLHHAVVSDSPGLFDGLQLLLAISALVVDAVALAAIAARISEFGFTPNRVAALGENLILLVNLAGSALLYTRFLLHCGPFGVLERWQIVFLPMYSIWAAFVVAVFPPVFGYR